METEKIFVNGLISKDVPDTAPDWILGKMSISVNELINWLEKNRKIQDDNGWINLTVKRSPRTGKRYIEVDTWKKTQDEVAMEVPKTDFVPPKVEVELNKKEQQHAELNNIPF